ncbi:MAG: nucleotidyltransferase domain-containing protein [Planctomycetes bacterium]|nr:nucleotidyltransferase domain-containing protein [Planctomycetota bacterium]
MPVMLRDQVVPRLRQCLAAAGAEVVAAYLFGSVARGQERCDSDVDVAVLLAHGPPRSLEALERIARLQDELSRAVGRDVDLVVLDAAPPDLLHRVLRDRVLLYESDHARRIEFEVQARNEYFDLLPNLERYRRAVLRRA